MERGEWHKAQNERISRLASEMAQEYVLGHNVVQSARYVALNEELRQAEVDKQWHDYAIDPPKVNYRSSG